MALREALTWPDGARQQVDGRSIAVRRAMDEIQIEADTALVRAWVDQGDGRLTLYIAEPGCLHRLAGNQDPHTPMSRGGETRDFPCEYRAFAITNRTRYVVTVTVTQYDYDKFRDARTWIFEGLAEEPIHFETPAEHYDDDPSEFARHLVGLIARAHTSATRDA